MLDKLKSFLPSSVADALNSEARSILSCLLAGQLLVPQSALQFSARRSLQDSELTLIDLQCHEGFVEIKVDATRLSTHVHIREVTLRLSLVAISTSTMRQTCELKLHSITASGEGLASRIVIWFAETFFKTLLETMVKNAIVDRTTGKQLSITKKPDNGNLEVDMSETAWAKRFAGIRPIPLFDKSIFDLLKVEQIEHHTEGVKLKLVKPSIGNPSGQGLSLLGRSGETRS